MVVLKYFNMKECKPVGTPFNANLKLLKMSNEEFGNVERKNGRCFIQDRVGSLMHVMVGMKVDLAFAVSTVS